MLCCRCSSMVMFWCTGPLGALSLLPTCRRITMSSAFKEPCPELTMMIISETVHRAAISCTMTMMLSMIDGRDMQDERPARLTTLWIQRFVPAAVFCVC